MRQLKYHEQKLLKKVNLLEWKGTSTQKEHSVISKYVIEERETYVMYNLIVGKIRRLSLALAKLNDNDEVKTQMVKDLTQKLYSLGLISAKTLLDCAKIEVSSFCKRRLASIMAETKMVPDIKTAVTFVKHGHVRVGTKICTDPGLIVSRALQDYVTWRDGSKIKATIDQFNERE